jgi:hypothetical protein
MFPGVPRWVTEHVRGAEAQVAFTRNQSQHRGFVDSLVDATAIEYESNLHNTTKFRTGYQQVKEYCAGLLNRGYPSGNIRGVLSDTVQWHAYNVRITNLEVQGDYSAEDIELIELESLDCQSNTNSNYLLLDFLTKHLGRIGSRLVNAASINADLGFESTLAGAYIPRLSAALQDISETNPEYSELIQSVWNKFVNSVRDDDTADTFDTNFYVDEYYLTTVAKFLCANVINGSALISDTNERNSILDGDFFKLRGYSNVVEYDFFGWLNNLPIHETIIELTEKVQLDLQAYDYSVTIQEDLFSNLFSELANKSRRLLLGQAMTPSWLANSIVKEVIDGITEPPQLIDMCCGSGTFIVETIKIVSADFTDNISSSEKKSKITSCITGFDIDPLAVILARINWLIVAKPFLEITGTDKITIPIYNADSLFAVTPVSTNEDLDESFVLRLSDHEVALPKQLLVPANDFLFEKIMDVGYSLLTQLSELPGPEFYEETLDRLLTQTDQELTDSERVAFTQFMQAYYPAIFELHSEGKNGIWNFLILNSYRPALVEHSFNGLVSNPPWLTLSRIADNPYREHLQNLANEFNIRPSGPAFLHTELATIFLLSSVERYLSTDAVIGCILPGTLLSGDHHHPFRNMEYRESGIHFKISEIWDLDKSIFNNRGITVFGTKTDEPNLNPIPAKLIQSRTENEEINLFLSTLDTKSAWTPFYINDTRTDSYVNHFVQGADIMPRSLYFHDITNYDASSVHTDINPINKQTSDKAYLLKDSKKFQDFRIERSQVETSVLFPVMISNALLPFHITDPPIAILPIEKHENRWRCIPVTSLVSMSTGFQRWVSRASSNYDDGNITSLWAKLDTRKKLSKQLLPPMGYVVCCGTGGGYVCAHYLNHDQVDFNRLVLDQTVNYYHTNDENEAIYLVGLLNSPTISEAISAFQAEGNFGARHIHSLPYRLIEPYDSDNASHQNVVAQTTALITALNDFFSASSDPSILRLRMPNESSISFKRRRIRELMTSLPSFGSYVEACNSVINGSHDQ